MLFSSLFFLYAFLPLILILFFLIKNTSYRRILLVIFSLIFYAWGEPVYVFLMIGTVVFNYIFGRMIDSPRFSNHSKLWTAAAVIINLVLLGIFKYTDFFINTVNSLFGTAIPLTSIRIPIGISFFIFQSISYIIDVYRGTCPSQKSFVKLLLYISFFPQLTAGPIVRYEDMASQLDRINPTPRKIFYGLFRFSVGLGKKAVIANSCAAAVDSLLGLTGAPTILARWAAALFFTLQIYFDFSGYSDMAIGLSEVFGFRIPENFAYPFISKSATEFWHRWHISLSTWFKDYLFYPVMRSRVIRKFTKKLSGSGHKKAARTIPTIIALFIVWSMTGLWHGANWNYILWGLYYFVFLTLEMFLQPVFKKIFTGFTGKFLSRIYFAVITVFGMAIFSFESDTFKNLGYLFGVGTGGFTDIYTNSVISENIFLLTASILLSLPVIPFLIRLAEKKLGKFSRKSKTIYMTVAIIFLVAVSTVRLAGNSYNPFLYFRF